MKHTHTHRCPTLYLPRSRKDRGDGKEKVSEALSSPSINRKSVADVSRRKTVGNGKDFECMTLRDSLQKKEKSSEKLGSIGMPYNVVHRAHVDSDFNWKVRPQIVILGCLH